jgi:dihydrofolate synthase/folylpolyglutamate synthase
MKPERETQANQGRRCFDPQHSDPEDTAGFDPGGQPGSKPEPGVSESFDPETFLDSLEPIGWKLGLERMEALCDELGRPQDRFGTIHVVGTNGKSSVARMTAALLQTQGLRAGCMVSPHLSSWSERVMVAGRQLEPGSFAAAVRRTAAAANLVNSRLEPEGSLTQFEISSAAGFLALAEADVNVAAVEAGLGGRLDATNSINSAVTVLTSIGLDHTEWLGDTEVEIAAEKLAVLRPGTVLVLGRVTADVRELALKGSVARGCRVVEPGEDLPVGLRLQSPALYQRWNFALAVAAAEQYLEATASLADEPSSPVAHERIRLPPEALRAAAGAAAVPGRLERICDEPPVFIDVAHNRSGAAALAASVPEVAAGSPVVGLVGILDDKDAGGIIAELAPVLDCVVFTGLPAELLAGSARPGAKGRHPEDLKRLAGDVGLEAEVRAEPAQALERAKLLAIEKGGLVLVAGSHYLLSPDRRT